MLFNSVNSWCVDFFWFKHDTAGRILVESQNLRILIWAIIYQITRSPWRYFCPAVDVGVGGPSQCDHPPPPSKKKTLLCAPPLNTVSTQPEGSGFPNCYQSGFQEISGFTLGALLGVAVAMFPNWCHSNNEDRCLLQFAGSASECDPEAGRARSVESKILTLNDVSSGLSNKPC